MLALLLCAAAPAPLPPPLPLPLALPQGSLTVLSDPAGSVTVSDCSADGQVLCGLTSVSNTTGTAWVWTAAAGFTPLPASPIDSFPPVPRSISGDGSVVVGFLNSPLNVIEGFRWSATASLTLLPAMSSANNIALSSPEATNGDGSLAGGYAYTSNIDQPFSWDAAGSPAVLRLAPGMEFGVVLDFSQGDVAAGAQWSSGGAIGFRHDPVGGTLPLAAGPFGAFSGASALSGDSSVAFGYAADTVFGADRVLRWDETGTPELLFDLPTEATAITRMRADHAGRSLVLTYRRTSGADVGLHWSEDRGLRTLPEVLADAGVTSNVTLRPTGLSADGNVIVGSLFGGDGFLLRLNAADPVPLGTESCVPPVPNSVGRTPGLGAFGTDGASSNDLMLWATDLPANTFAMILSSRQTAMQPGFGGSLGTLCLGSPLGRFSALDQIRAVGPLGRMSLRVDTTAIPDGAGVSAALPGESWHFQCWYRDRSGSTAVSNLTSARTVVFQ